LFLLGLENYSKRNLDLLWGMNIYTRFCTSAPTLAWRNTRYNWLYSAVKNFGYASVTLRFAVETACPKFLEEYELTE